MVNQQSDHIPATQAPDQPQGWEIAAIRRAHMLHSQLEAAVGHARNSTLAELREMDFFSAGSPYMQRLVDFYRENISLARLLDSSDLLLHAEGPGAADHSPSLNAVNWLCSGAEQQIRHLMGAMLPMALKDVRAATRDLDLRLTGLAPGSLYAGFSLEGLDRSGMLSATPQDDIETVDRLRQSLHALPVVPHFVGLDKVNSELMEALPDPALRDAAMVAAYELAPTGKRGIHTLQISAPRAKLDMARAQQSLGQPERVVLKAALRGAPMMRKTQKGRFTGVLRAVDLDTGRITLRGVSDDISAIRGALRVKGHDIKMLLDKPVRIEGEYEANADGMPRLMLVDHIEAAHIEMPLDH